MNTSHQSYSEPLEKDTLRNMILIPSGDFRMGSTEGSLSERPIRTIYLDAYYLDLTPVTNADFAHFVAETGYVTSAERAGFSWGYSEPLRQFIDIPGLHWRSYATEDRAQHPVVLVDWQDATAYAEWIGKVLPTEAQWEKAARGGLDGTLYPWGDTAPDGTQCNFANPPAALPPTHPVTAFPPNAYGLYDMVGNVWQWCSDSFTIDAYRTLPERNPVNHAEGNFKVRRGGSWNVIQSFRLRNANRGSAALDTRVSNLGFRCAFNPK